MTQDEQIEDILKQTMNGVFPAYDYEDVVAILRYVLTKRDIEAECKAIMRYANCFYVDAMCLGMSAREAQDAVQHVERAVNAIRAKVQS